MKKFVLVFVAALALLTIIISALNIFIIEKTSSYIDFEKKQYDCILVLGAGLRADGTPSDMLADRLSLAISLYKLGYSDIVLLSGDRSGEEYDEVSAMKAYCVDNGVPEENILCDNIGYSTFESIYNTKSFKEFEKILIVTQGYHLHRALYIARKMDIEAYGAASDPREYRGQIVRDVRESFARIKDFFKLMIYD